MSKLEFFKSLDYSDGINVIRSICKEFPLQYGTTLGLDGHPQIRPIEFKFASEDVLYFDTVKTYTSYKEMQAHPFLQICVCDQETMTYLRVGGKVNFTEDAEIINQCFDHSPVLTSQFGDKRDQVIAYYLTEAWAEFASFSPDLQYQRYNLKNKYDNMEATE